MGVAELYGIPMDKKQIELLGAVGHGIGATINVLGYMWNRNGSLFFRLFHTAAAGIHTYAVYQHLKSAGESERVEGR